MQKIDLRASATQTTAETETGSGISVYNYDQDDKFQEATFVLDVTAAATEAGDTLDVYVDVSPDEGTTWINAIHFAQVVGNGGAVRHVAKLTSGALNDPDATLDVTSDAAAGVVRNIGMYDYIRYRGVTVDVTTTSNMSFTYSLAGYFR